ncbi:glutamine-hydrolyzing GMP synthase, partial [Candidatus Bipolaricaulota bacterium]|nr:glutamine-hydrolyzing GMP synthase [Candidatus Bipolaricaulota bacterium]
MSVVILDFGSQYSRLIARRIRELNAYSVILPGSATIERIKKEEPQAIIFSGSPKSVFEQGAPMPDPAVYDLGIPILGICYGMQLLARQFRGDVRDAGTRSYGADALVRHDGRLFADLTGSLPVWMSHATTVHRLPDGWTSVAATNNNPHAAMASSDERFVGVQFHPEVVHTPDGARMLSNFLDMAGVPREWTAKRNVERLIQEVRDDVGSDGVLLGVSGGVDSSALALLLAKA